MRPSIGRVALAQIYAGRVADDFDCCGVFLHAGIKFPWFVFFQKDSGLRPPDPPWNMRLAMIFFAALCIGLGVWPQPLYAMLPFAVDFVPYTASHVVFYLQLLLFSGLAFFLMLGWLKRMLTITLDVDWLYRKPGPLLARRLDQSLDTAWLGIAKAAAHGARGLVGVIHEHHAPEGILARTWPTRRDEGGNEANTSWDQRRRARVYGHPAGGRST